MRKILLSVLFLSFPLVACSNAQQPDAGSSASKESTPSMHEGEVCSLGKSLVDGAGGAYCVLKETSVNVSFRCPSNVRFRHDFAQHVVCASTSDLSTETMELFRTSGIGLSPMVLDTKASCSRPNASLPAKDTCNRCVCRSGAWACTQRACSKGMPKSLSQ